MLGVTHIIASGAVGSLREEFKPRDLVVPDQVIDKTHRRASTFYEKAAVHVEFAEPFCPVMRRILLEEGAAIRETQDNVINQQSAISNQQCNVHDRGCYVCMEGPAFSTRAESLMHRLWGGDLIGMTCLPEAKLAKEAEIAYALIALVTDYDCWKTTTPKDAANACDPAVLLKEIIANLQTASDNAAVLIQRALGRIARDPQALAESPAAERAEAGDLERQTADSAGPDRNAGAAVEEICRAD